LKRLDTASRRASQENHINHHITFNPKAQASKTRISAFPIPSFSSSLQTPRLEESFYRETSKATPPGPSPSAVISRTRASPSLLLLLSRLPGLGSAQLRLRQVLLGSLGQAERRGARNGVAAQVRAVSRLGRRVGDGLVGSARPGQHGGARGMREGGTHFLVVLFPPKVTLCACWPGRCGCLTFLVIRVTPPLSPSAAATPTACPSSVTIPSVPPIPCVPIPCH
jgi:hypothetical protein